MTTRAKVEPEVEAADSAEAGDVAGAEAEAGAGGFNAEELAELVAEYLAVHPQFFAGRGELLAGMELPAAEGKEEEQAGVGGREDFYPRLVETLRNRHEQQQARMEWMVDTARGNQDRLWDLHRVTLALFGEVGEEEEGLAERLAGLVKEGFGLDDVVVFLASQQEGAQQGKVDYAQLCQRVSHLSSVCDDRVGADLLGALFSVAGICSCAFVPLAFRGKLYGVMVLGAVERTRFQPDMGVLLVDRLGELLGGYIARVEGKEGRGGEEAV